MGAVKVSAELKAFMDRLGHRFATRPDNQRLEFLGDRVLGLVIAQAILEEDVAAAEGVLAPRYNALVRKETCADVARGIDLGAVLKLGKSERARGRAGHDPAVLGPAHRQR